MHTEMYENPATKRNIDLLRSDGVIIIEPEVGDLACKDYGIGRMASDDTILNTINYLIDLPLKDKKLVISAGGTREYIDDVRFIGNDSSGILGHEIAKQAHLLGAEVTLISSNRYDNEAFETIHIQSAQELNNAIKSKLSPKHDLIMAAAVQTLQQRNVKN